MKFKEVRVKCQYYSVFIRKAVGFSTNRTSRAMQISRFKVLKSSSYSQKIKLRVRSSSQGVNYYRETCIWAYGRSNDLISSHLYISLMSTVRLRRETSACDVFWRTWTYGDKFSFLLVLRLDKVCKNSTTEQIACIWQIERVQIGAIKFGRTQIHFLATFSLPSSSSLPRKAVI